MQLDQGLFGLFLAGEGLVLAGRIRFPPGLIGFDQERLEFLQVFVADGGELAVRVFSPRGRSRNANERNGTDKRNSYSHGDLQVKADTIQIGRASCRERV